MILDPKNILDAKNLTWLPMNTQGLANEGQLSVLAGDPSKPGPFTARFRFPAGYAGATHSHPVDEFITIFSGKGRMAFGLRGEEAGATPFGPGSFINLATGVWHGFCVGAERDSSMKPAALVATPARDSGFVGSTGTTSQ